MTTRSRQSVDQHHRRNHPFVDLAELLAAPLTALIDADAYAAEAFAEFIREYGFESSEEEDFGKLRMVTFSYSKGEPDGRSQTYQASIALLALLPLPALTIKDADFRFNVEVLGAVRRPAPARGKLSTAAQAPRHSVHPHRLLARIGRTAARPAVRGEEELAIPEVHMKVRINVAQGDLPGGVTQFLTMMASSTSEFQQRQPSIIVQARDGKTAFTGASDSIELKLLAVDAARVPQPGVKIRLSQDMDHLMKLPARLVQTDGAGRASVKVVLVRAAPAGTGRVFKTVSMRAIVQSKDGGSYDASGSIVLEVPRLPG